MRSLALLGRQDPGARKAFWLFHNLSAVIVVALNVLLVLLQRSLCEAVSNDSSVQQWLGQIWWVLTVHMQTRISSLATCIFYVPLGRGMLRTLLNVVTFYCVAAPISGLVALSDVVTTSVSVKLGACVGATSIAQGLQIVFNFVHLHRLDWHRAGAGINRRANMDRGAECASADSASLTSGGSDPLANAARSSST